MPSDAAVKAGKLIRRFQSARDTFELPTAESMEQIIDAAYRPLIEAVEKELDRWPDTSFVEIRQALAQVKEGTK